MKVLKSHLEGQWVAGSGLGAELFNPTTGEVVATASTDGLDLGRALAFARDRGGPALRALSFAQRGALLGKMAKVLHANRDELLDLSTLNNGATRGDGKFDVDGATGTLAAYAALGASLGERTTLLDGEAIQLGRSPRFVGQHLRVPLHGVAVHVNAFNFPAWGYAEKAAVAILAGMPVLSKPAPQTALVTVRCHQLLVEAGILPEGALSLLTGEPGGLLSHLRLGDVLAFTGSRTTGAHIRRTLAEADRGARLNVEADSTNAAVIGPDADPDDDTWASCLFDVVRDMTQKTGQKCTAIRRLLVPAQHLDRAVEELRERLSDITVGDPALSSVRMGPLVTARQLAHVREGAARLAGEATLAFGTPNPASVQGADPSRGYFVTPMLFRCDDPTAAVAVHAEEVFGPVATVMPYDGSAEEAVALVRRGQGGLVTSLYTDDGDFARTTTLELAPWLGRIYIGGGKVAEHSPGPGAVFPSLTHGGPGRAGEGEELGGERGLSLYTQRVAVQGYKPLVERTV